MKEKGDSHQKRGQAIFPCLSPFFLLLVTVTFLLFSCNQRSAETPPQIESVPSIVDRIVLTNGGRIEGKLVEETPNMVRIEMQEGVVGFHPSEIQTIERGISKALDSQKEAIHVPTFESEESRKEKWPAGVKHRVLLKNGEWVDGEIVRKLDHVFTVRQQIEGGGAIEHDLDSSQIERIRLWPPDESDPALRFKDFQERYPSLRPVQKGNYHILTSEQDAAELKYYLKTLDQFYDDFSLHFFELIDVDKNPEPLDVVIFGTHAEFSQALKEIGFNLKSNPIGFYHFNAKKLVFYNMKTEEAIQTYFKESHEQQEQLSKMSAEGIYDQGSLDRATEKSERGELKLLAEINAQNTRVIRHEGAHQLFHLFGITPLEVYSGAWLIEGIAVYCETDPIGDVHEEKLMQLRFELEKRDLMPLEYLLNFSRGKGLHQLDPLYANLAYSESWALIQFLMTQGYRENVFNYLKEMRVQGPEFDSAAELKLLEKHLGKDLKIIETEFFPYVRKLIAENIDDETYEDFRIRFIKSM